MEGYSLMMYLAFGIVVLIIGGLIYLTLTGDDF
jgi:hypothetical protein